MQETRASQVFLVNFYDQMNINGLNDEEHFCFQKNQINLKLETEDSEVKVLY
jgi:hypothetical protein